MFKFHKSEINNGKTIMKFQISPFYNKNTFIMFFSNPCKNNNKILYYLRPKEIGYDSINTKGSCFSIKLISGEQFAKLSGC